MPHPGRVPLGVSELTEVGSKLKDNELLVGVELRIHCFRSHVAVAESLPIWNQTLFAIIWGQL
ncbi:unnamed protein product [Prunus armeniaca]